LAEVKSGGMEGAAMGTVLCCSRGGKYSPEESLELKKKR